MKSERTSVQVLVDPTDRKIVQRYKSRFGIVYTHDVRCPTDSVCTLTVLKQSTKT